MLVSKSKAAKLAGVSRTTIHRYANEGKLSLTGSMVDTSELVRVFGQISEQPVTPVQVDTIGQHVTTSERVLLRDHIGLLEAQIRDIRSDRDEWRDKTSELTKLLQAEQETTKLLTHQSKPGSPGITSILSTAAGVLVAVFALAGLLYLLIGVIRV